MASIFVYDQNYCSDGLGSTLFKESKRVQDCDTVPSSRNDILYIGFCLVASCETAGVRDDYTILDCTS
jgi:hypothetical protein